MTKNILHLANFNSTNIGNGALIYGTERVIKEDIDKNINFTPLAWDDYTFELKEWDEKFVQLVNKHDALLVNGAVTFNGREYLKNTGMRFNLPLELWPKIKVPIIFYGVSYRVWPGQKYYNSDKLKETFKYALTEKNIIFAVRNDGTRNWIEQNVGIKTDKIYEIPDPGLFVPTKTSHHPELEDKKLNVILSLNNEDEGFRYNNFNKAEFMKQLAKVIEKLILERQINLILAPHYFDDFQMIDDFIQLIKPQIAHQHIVAGGLYKVKETSYFYDCYNKADLAISMRVHSLSPAIGLGTPVIPLISQDRIRNFLTKAGLLDLAIDINNENFTNNLSERIDYCLDNKQQVSKKLNQTTKVMRKQIYKFNQLVDELINS